MANILHRLGDAQNKKFLLPCNNTNYTKLGWPLKFPGGSNFNGDCDHPEAVNQFDIICNHAVYNRIAMLAYLKKAPPPFVFTILREPVSQIQSAFNYFLHDNRVADISASLLWKEPTEEGTMLMQQIIDNERAAGKDLWDDRIDFLKKVKNHPDKFDKNHAVKMSRPRFLNSQSHDLGWYEANDWNILPSDEDIQKWVEGLDFSYVMLTEMFDEGLTLLSQKLNLMLEDVSNLHMKQLSYPHFEPSAEQSAELHDLLHIDFKLYAHYKKKFMQEWETYGNSVALKKLRELNAHISSACDQKNDVHEQSVYPADCTWAMRADNIEYTKYLSKKQALIP